MEQLTGTSRRFPILALAALLAAGSIWFADGSVAAADQRTGATLTTAPAPSPTPGKPRINLDQRSSLVESQTEQAASDPKASDSARRGSNSEVAVGRQGPPSVAPSDVRAVETSGLPELSLAENNGPMVLKDLEVPLFVLVDVHGTYADFTIKSASPSIFGVAVSTGAFQSNEFGNIFDEDTIVFTALGLLAGAKTDGAFQALPLLPDTAYSFAVWAKDPSSGEEQLETGTFRTLKRNILWTIEKITVTDDSDDLSAGDLHFQFKASGGGSGVTSGEYSFTISTDDSAHPYIPLMMEDVSGSSVTVQALGVDDDVDDPTGSLFLFWPGCSSSDNPWDVACGSKTVGGLAQTGPGEEVSTSANFSASGHSLEFTVYSTVQVVYAP